jgi:ATP-binding cassette subfamily B protein
VKVSDAARSPGVCCSLTLDDIRLTRLLRPHWKQLALALLAVLGITAADVLQPWPVKIVLDYVLARRPMPDWLASFLTVVFGGNTNAILIFAIVSVVVITSIDSISSYVESYVMTSVGQWIAHDIRRAV